MTDTQNPNSPQGEQPAYKNGAAHSSAGVSDKDSLTWTECEAQVLISPYRDIYMLWQSRRAELLAAFNKVAAQYTTPGSSTEPSGDVAEHLNETLLILTQAMLGFHTQLLLADVFQKRTPIEEAGAILGKWKEVDQQIEQSKSRAQRHRAKSENDEMELAAVRAVQQRALAAQIACLTDENRNLRDELKRTRKELLSEQKRRTEFQKEAERKAAEVNALLAELTKAHSLAASANAETFQLRAVVERLVVDGDNILRKLSPSKSR